MALIQPTGHTGYLSSNDAFHLARYRTLQPRPIMRQKEHIGSAVPARAVRVRRICKRRPGIRKRPTCLPCRGIAIMMKSWTDGSGRCAVDEFALIRRLTRNRTGSSGTSGDAGSPEHAEAAGDHGVVVGIGDDAAVVRPTSGMHTVLTCDTIVEITHFLPWTMDDESIGWKAMASNVSDLAAMGALPRYALVALSVPRRFPVERLDGIYAGLYACGDRYGVTIVGGDTTASPERLTITVTAVGEVEAGRALLRSGARPGDVVFVTGGIGMAAAGLDYLQRRKHEPAADVLPADEPWAGLIAAHRRPEPRVAAGRALLGLATALNDISDGLASESWEIAEASGVRVALDETALRAFAAQRACEALQSYAVSVGRDPLEFMLYGGEDYELVGTVPAERTERMLAALQSAGTRAVFVGVVREGTAGVELVRGDGTSEAVGKNGYNHFDEPQGNLL